MDAPTIPPPPDLAWLVALVGERAALALIETRGGTRVQVPATEEGCRRSYLAEIIGLEALRALARQHAGNYITLPLARAWRARIYLARGGMSQAEVALKIGLTEKAVQRMAAPGYRPMGNAHNGARPKTAADDGQKLLPF